MDKRIDCKGMACPIPVINAKKAMEAFTEDGTLYVAVDNEIAVQNLTRLGEHNGFEVTASRDGEKAFMVAIRVKAGAVMTASPEQISGCDAAPKGSRVVVLSSKQMGTGDAKLGEKLVKAFIFALTSQDKVPDKIICYNSGAYLTTEDPDTIRDLRSLEKAGATVMTCGTCLDFYGLKDKLQVGIISNMYDIVEAQMNAAVIIRP